MFFLNSQIIRKCKSLCILIYRENQDTTIVPGLDAT